MKKILTPSEMAKKSWKVRKAGKTKKEISEMMSAVRKGGNLTNA
jgi:hypothetical protein